MSLRKKGLTMALGLFAGGAAAASLDKQTGVDDGVVTVVVSVVVV
jgi:hypothetical protein